MAMAASPPTNPRLPSWKGRQASNGGRLRMATPKSEKGRISSGVPDRSVAKRTTSVATPASSHDLAVMMPVLAPVHMAETDMAGPWKSNSCIICEMTVEGIRFIQRFGRTRAPSNL